MSLNYIVRAYLGGRLCLMYRFVDYDSALSEAIKQTNKGFSCVIQELDKATRNWKKLATFIPPEIM